MPLLSAAYAGGEPAPAACVIAERAILRVTKRRNGQRRDQGRSCERRFLQLGSSYSSFPCPLPGVSLPRRARVNYLGIVGGGENSAPLSPLPSAPAQCGERPHVQQADACPTRSCSSSAERRSWPESAKENKVRFSCARCMKYIKPSAALQMARKRNMLTSPAVEKF